MSPVILYARKSSESEDAQILSIDAQVEALLTFAKDQGLEVSRVLTESRSARAPGREAFDAMLLQVRRRQVGGILCWALDRLARNPVDGAAVIWALDQSQLQHVVTPQRVFTDTPTDKFWMQLEFGMAKKYVDDLSLNVKRGNEAKRERGWLPGKAPVGYLNDRRTKTIVADPARFPLVRRIWELALSGTSVSAIHRVAVAEWRLTTTGSASPISFSHLHRLLRSPFYYGVLTSNGSTYVGAHPAMISRQEYDSVQELLRRPEQRFRGSHSFPYTQLIRCGKCGGSVTAERKVNRYGSRYTYYHCSHHLRGARCRQLSIRAEVLERQMLDFVRTIRVPDSLRDWALAHLEGYRRRRSFDHLIATATQRTRADLTAQLRRLTDLRLRDLVTDDEYQARRAQIRADLTRLDLHAPRTSTSAGRSPSSTTMIFPNVILDYLRRADAGATRRILALLGSYTLVDRRLRATSVFERLVRTSGPEAPETVSVSFYAVRSSLLPSP